MPAVLQDTHDRTGYQRGQQSAGIREGEEHFGTLLLYQRCINGEQLLWGIGKFHPL